MKTYIITGAGSGIGRATAAALASLPGARVVLVGRQPHLLDETRQQLPNPEIHGVHALDVRDRKSWQLALRNESNLNLCGVFANAGVGGANQYGDHDRWSEVIDINLTGTYITIMETLPYLRQSTEKYRHVAITSSCLARFGVAGYTAYCTAKTGLLGLTRSLALELAADNILVNALCPGWVDTAMARAGIQRLAGMESKSYPDMLAEQLNLVPLKRMSKPEEIGELVKFLFSSGQTSITGQGIDINNGSFMI